VHVDTTAENIFARHGLHARWSTGGEARWRGGDERALDAAAARAVLVALRGRANSHRFYLLAHATAAVVARCPL
jgi:hypothetical protein